MNPNITISVVIPMYNSANYIERTLDNIREQTVWPDEVVLVDDGSSDKTFDLVQIYLNTKKNKFPPAKLIKQENQGAGGARNTGINNAEHEWISFLDSDDLWDKKKIEYVKEAISNNPQAQMISHNMRVVEQESNIMGDSTAFEKKYNPNDSLFVQLYAGGFLPTASVTVKKSLLMDVGLFDVSLRSSQDYDMWLKCSLKMNNQGCLYIIDKPLVYYMITKGSISFNYKRRYKCGVKVLLRYRNHLDDYMKKDVKKYARRSLYRFTVYEMYSSLRRGNLQAAVWIGVNIIKDTICNNYVPDKIGKFEYAK